MVEVITCRQERRKLGEGGGGGGGGWLGGL